MCALKWFCLKQNSLFHVLRFGQACDSFRGILLSGIRQITEGYIEMPSSIGLINWVDGSALHFMMHGNACR